MQYGTDGMGKYYTYQMHNNEIEKYIVEQIYEPEKQLWRLYDSFKAEKDI